MIIDMNHTDLALGLTATGAIAAVAATATAAAAGGGSLEHGNGYLASGLSSSTSIGTMDYMEKNSTANCTSSINDTGRPTLDPVLIERFTRNRSIDSPWYYILIAMYSVLIVFGAVGNVLVVIAVLRKPIMRTARNLFILNLAVSDLLLCLVTMPLTLMEILSKYWPFGSCTVLCKVIAMLQAVSIYVSTISITAIAFDRYQVIVYPTRDSLQFGSAVMILAGIWLLALLLASPMFIFKRLIHADIPPVLQALGINGVSFCIEDWPLHHGRFYYSIFSLCVQYLMPILIVSGAYFGIYNKLKNRITVVTVQASSQRKAERGRRMKRTNCLLISIAIIFGVSWLPLNFFNLYADMRGSAVTQSMIVIYAVCHMTGMSSACSNPLLYGWLNDNFRKEFQELLCRYKQPTNVALNGHTTGSSVQTRRRRKHADITKGDLKLLASGGGGGGGSGANGGAGNGDGGEANSCTGGNGINDTDFMTGCSMAGNNIYGLRSAITESVALTENPMSTEITTLMPR